MAPLPVTQGVVTLDIGHWLPRQAQSLGRVDRRCRRRFTVGQPVQNVDDMGLGRKARLERQFHSAEHGLLVMLEHQGQDLDHLPVAARAAQELTLPLPEGFGQLGEGRAVAQSARLALNDGEIVPSVIDRPAGQVMGAINDPGVFT